MFSYQQSTGQFRKDGELLATGYSGNGEGLNNPEWQNIRMHGPIPRGKYTICHYENHPNLGPVAMRLLPYSTNQMFLRDGFFIHGDNAQMDHSASDGCIILDRGTRLHVSALVADGDNELEVTL